MTNLAAIRKVVERLNGLYGRGNVVAVRLFLDGRGEFDRTPYGCKRETRVFRISENTVFACGHQGKVAK